MNLKAFQENKVIAKKLKFILARETHLCGDIVGTKGTKGL